MNAPVIVIAGPTAGGKSGLALHLAARCDGTVINADSMQIYRELRILTARPGPNDQARVPHRLYGTLPAAEACSAGRWQALATAAIRAAWAEGRLPILVGGTGLYLRALMRGLAPVPEIPADVRQRARDDHQALGGGRFRNRLAARDPVMAARLESGDRQRLIRAWEVIEASGRSLADWQAEPPAGRLDARYLTITVLPDRAPLYGACDRRFDLMIEAGGLDEARDLVALGLDPHLPAMKALGVAPLRCHLAGKLDFEAARAAAKQATRNYAKRQTTWFRRQLAADLVVSDARAEAERVAACVARFRLTPSEARTSVPRLSPGVIE